MITCPHCGSRNNRPGNQARTTGMIVGGMAGAAFVVLRIINRTSPVLASALLAGGLIGLLWGGEAGHAIGTKVDEISARGHRCHACGKGFDV